MSSWVERPLVRLALCALSALLLWLGSPGIDQTWALPFALVPWVVVSLRGGRFRKSLDALTGIATLSLWLYWLADLIGPAFGIVLIVECLQWVFVGVTLRATRGKVPTWLALAVSWTGLEFLLGTQPIGGFPWLFLGHGYANWSYALHTAAFWGVLGLSFLSAATSGVAASDFLAGRWRPRRWGVLAVVWALVLGFGATRAHRTVSWEPGPSVVGVQPNIAQGQKESRTALEIFQRTVDVSLEPLHAARLLRGAFQGGFTGGIVVPPPRSESARDSLSFQGPDLLVWPETKLLWGLGEGRPGEVYRVPGREAEIPQEDSEAYEQALVRQRLGAHLLASSATSFASGATFFVRAGEGWERRNVLLLFDPELRYGRAARYDKRRLVPGGEFIPLLDDLPNADEAREWITNVVGYLPDLRPGDRVGLMTLANGEGDRLRFGVQICYDNAYWDPFLDATRAGARFHLVVSNEGWYGRSVEFDHMRAFSSFRAVENARSIVRVTNTGISMLVDPLGRVVRQVRDSAGLDRDVAGWLWVRPPLSDEETFYASSGELLGPACTTAWLLWAAWACSRGLVRKARGSLGNRRVGRG